MVLIKQRRPLCDAVLVQQHGRYRPDILLLEDTEVPPQPAPP
ncbi:hypothetical protein [Escherichia coli Nissle 1917]|nr:hypothetical protein [Escherichia coli Nissle 1917]